MPMSRGQRIRPCISDEDAVTALTQLADRNPTLSKIIIYLGQRILDLPGVCLRVDGEHTYDLAFIRPPSPHRPRSRSKAFVAFNSPTYPGDWMPARRGTLRVGVMVDRSAMFEDSLLQQRRFSQRGTGLWHDVCIGHTVGIPAGTVARQLQAVFDTIERAYNSFE